MRKILFISLLILSFKAIPYAQEFCGFDKNTRDFFSGEKPYRDYLHKLIRNYHSGEGRVSAISLRDEIVIPLVFHIFNKSSSLPGERIDEADIYRQVDLLNKAFAGTNWDRKNIPELFRKYMGSSTVRFCIGSRTVDGKMIKGIEFYETGEDYFADKLIQTDNKRHEIKHKEYGGADAWDSEKYINIWIGETRRLRGQSTFPGIPARYKDEEGIILNIKTVKGDDLYSKVIIHEMGHYLGLLHIWGEKGCDNDDGIEDTPLQDYYYTGCPEGEKISCGSADMYVNYMDYTDDRCSLMFTAGQVEAMMNILATYRKGLLEGNDYCYSASGSGADFGISISTNGGNIVFTREKLINEKVEISVFDILGHKIARNIMYPYQSLVEIPAYNLSRGVYLIIMQLGKKRKTVKLALF